MRVVKKYVLGISIILLIVVKTQAQDISSYLKSTIKNDLKKDLFRNIKPRPMESPNSFQGESLKDGPIGTESLEEFNQKYIRKSGGAEYEGEYSISPYLYLPGENSEPLNKLPDGYVVPVFTGGHWLFANPTNRVDGLVYPSGRDFSGGGRKKMSEKSKSIIENVFNLKVEE